MKKEVKKRLVFTGHARQRAKLYGISYPQLQEMFEDSQPEKMPKDMISNSYKKYRDKQEGVFYRRNGAVVMVAKDTQDSKTGEDITLLITLCDQRVNLTHFPEGKNESAIRELDLSRDNGI